MPEILGYTEMLRHRLESIGRHVTRSQIVELDHQIGVKHRPARQIATLKIHPTLGHLQAAFPERCFLPKPPPCARNLVLVRPHPKVFEVKIEDVVTFDHIGIPFLEVLVQRFEQGLFGGIILGIERQKCFLFPHLEANRQHPLAL